MGFLNKLFFPPKSLNVFNTKRYLRDLENGEFRNHWNLGVCDNSWLLKDFTREPNAIYLGAMGSGKSVAASYTAVTWMLANSDQTILFIADTVKGANDYQALFDLDQVYPVLSSEVGIHRVIDLLYDEAMARRNEFNEVQAESIYEYEKKTGKTIAKCILLIEEFHAVPYVILNFDKDYKIENTSAFKFHQLMRIGRSMGIWVIACSQRGTKSDVPSEIVSNFTQKQIFRISKGESSYFLGDVKASEIRSDQKGRCETEYGSVQFPYMTIATQRVLLKKYAKPLTAECCYLTPKLIDDYIKGRSTEELYRLKRLPDLVEGIESFEADLVVAMIHKKLGHTVKMIDSKIDPFGVSMTIDWPNKGRIAVMIRVGSKKITGKHIHKLRKSMETMGCARGILYTSAEDLPQTVYKNANDNHIEIVDHEDMLRLAHQIEAKALALKDLDPSKLADDAKESGEYQKVNGSVDEEIDDSVYEEPSPEPQMAPSSSPKVIPIKTTYIQAVEDGSEEIAPKVIEDKEAIVAQETLAKLLSPQVKVVEVDDLVESENPGLSEVKTSQEEISSEISKSVESALISSGRSSVKPTKRVQVRGTFFLKSDEVPELLVHFQKNTQGEVYRAIMYVVFQKEVRYKYFLDRQVQGEFDIKDRARLSIIDTKDWNTQTDDLNRRPVYTAAEFEKEFAAYLENFKQYELGNVKAICWSEDAQFLRNLLARSRYMHPEPTVMEEMAEVYGVDSSKEELIMQNQKSIKKLDIYTPAEVDLQVWKTLSP